VIRIERITRKNVQLFISVRLEALKESPSAFGSTYAREAAFTEEEWLARLERWNGEMGVGFLAMDSRVECGIAGGLLNLEDETRAQLVSMWTAPTHRRHGVGQLLVDAVVDWARSRKIKTLTLMVVSTNGPAIRFYEQLGFARTGRTDPYPNDPSIVEYEMSRAIHGF
jgi:ribosomal protein S18 acetylase RimI-like enzyme